MIPKHHQDLFTTPAFPAQGLSARLVSPRKGLCCHHRFARTLAHCHYKQWVPGWLIGLGVRSFRLEILQQSPFLLWIVKNNGFLIIKYLWFVNFKYISKKNELRKNSSFNWFTPFHMLIRPDMIWKNSSCPLYHIHFTMIPIHGINCQFNPWELISVKFKSKHCWWKWIWKCILSMLAILSQPWVVKHASFVSSVLVWFNSPAAFR